MRGIILFLLISVIFLSCKINQNRIIGKDSSTIPYGTRGLYCDKNINGDIYTVHGAYHRNKVITYVLDKGIIIDYYFSDLVEYDKVKEIPFGISYAELVNILGEPVGLLYGSDYIEEIEKGSVHDTFGATYFQREKKKNKISNEVVIFGFTYDSKLKSIKQSHQME